jgi:hypothetical protein
LVLGASRLTTLARETVHPGIAKMFARRLQIVVSTEQPAILHLRLPASSQRDAVVYL